MTARTPDPTGMPSSVRNARTMVYAAVVLMVIGALLGFVMQDEAVDAVLEGPNGDSLTIQEAEDLVQVVLVVTLVISLLIGALLAFCASRFADKANWARIVVTVMSGLYLVFGLLGLVTSPSPPLSMAISVINLVLAAGIVFMLWRPESQVWFRKEPRYIEEPGYPSTS